MEGTESDTWRGDTWALPGALETLTATGLGPVGGGGGASVLSAWRLGAGAPGAQAAAAGLGAVLAGRSGRLLPGPLPGLACRPGRGLSRLGGSVLGLRAGVRLLLLRCRGELGSDPSAPGKTWGWSL